MNKKILKLGILTVAGAAIVAMKKSKKEKLVYSYPQTKVKKSDYKNTELNKQKKIAKEFITPVEIMKRLPGQRNQKI